MSGLEGVDFTDDEWREYQSIPEQGYSHRDWLDQRNRKVMARLLAEAWDEGYDAGTEDESDAYWGHLDSGTTNPYRSEAADE